MSSSLSPRAATAGLRFHADEHSFAATFGDTLILRTELGIVVRPAHLLVRALSTSTSQSSWTYCIATTVALTVPFSGDLAAPAKSESPSQPPSRPPPAGCQKQQRQRQQQSWEEDDGQSSSSSSLHGGEDTAGYNYGTDADDLGSFRLDTAASLTSDRNNTHSSNGFLGHDNGTGNDPPSTMATAAAAAGEELRRSRSVAELGIVRSRQLRLGEPAAIDAASSASPALATTPATAPVPAPAAAAAAATHEDDEAVSTGSDSPAEPTPAAMAPVDELFMVA
ncbi:hypothetical protein VTJ49DRAFT_2516 [Mycothermus thermophilus]|uniref:Uncharacterized protein n=1 Tax=Humicola insolens TaxID=85995 RepID=A0ABR3VAY3_HUMIN